MSGMLGATVSRAVREYVEKRGILNPILDVTNAAKNGECFSGFVYRIIAKQNLENPKTQPKEVQLVAKVPPTNLKRRKTWNTAKHYNREHYAYYTILPAFEEFQKRHLPEKEIFKQYPKPLDASIQEADEYILLTDLAAEKFLTEDRPTPLNYDKCSLVLKNLAHFHAISFAYKSQDKTNFEKLTSQLSEITFAKNGASMPILSGIIRKICDKFLPQLKDPEDAELKSKLKSFSENCEKTMTDCCQENEDSVIVHGDCWISNFMFRENGGIDDMRILDWQVVRYTSVAIDLSFFIFCCTDEEVRKRLPELLRNYHKALIERIDQLGGDGQAIFPLERLLWHMKTYGKFGLGMALLTLHATCCKSSELCDVNKSLDQIIIEEDGSLSFSESLLQNAVYVKRLAGVCRDVIRLGYI